ncbi:YibE/F family protein [Saccharicrinis aurantiacus]|uniref:YibE/F family protein n=1 Tax=Saccharicrinis aurantiacus TaxID=1849719 RepID=UPI002490E938|nr:YibE/F family protein [Saccharicrinis aurantiacus]
MTKKKQNIIFLLVVLLFTVVLIFIPTGFENPSLHKNTERVKAVITAVNNSDLQNHGIVTTGTQNLKINILAGMHKGDTISATNVLMGQKRIDKIFAIGDKVLAIVKTDNQKILTARAEDYYRISIEWILLAVFALFLIGFAGITGFKALLSFIFTALTLWKILLPLILKGFSPIVSAFAIIVLCTTVIIILINGFSKKGLVALVGSISGVGITCCLALLFAHFFRIPGTVQDFSETLLYVGYTHLDLPSIFIACIFIAAAGAVMDVAMDISAAQNEIIDHNPSITTKALIRSGFNVAYPVIGTMTTTLLFAYSGSFMFVFMVFMAKGTPLNIIVNTNYVAAEILRTLVGSFGLVLVAPITAIVGGFIYVRNY